MTGSVVSRRVYEMLVKHLAEIEEEKSYVLEKFYPVLTNERTDFQELLNSYITNMQDIIHNQMKVEDGAADDCPFVIIGSNVTLRDTYTNKLEKLKIVSPFMSKISYDVDNASYLSPMGRAFLLKKINDDVRVETPMGIFEYQVKAIEFN